MQGLGAGKIEKGLVNRQGLHQRCQRQHPRPNLAADGDVMIHPRANHHDVRTAFQRLPSRHCRADAELPGDIAGSGDNTALAPANNHRPVTDVGIVALFDRGIEGITVNMCDRQAEQFAPAAHIGRPAGGAGGRRCRATNMAAAKTGPAQHLKGAAIHQRMAGKTPCGAMAPSP